MVFIINCHSVVYGFYKKFLSYDINQWTCFTGNIVVTVYSIGKRNSYSIGKSHKYSHYEKVYIYIGMRENITKENELILPFPSLFILNIWT